jgi:hypothetical protein
MEMQHGRYYAEILILVDGWPWNLSEFDFRRFFADGSCPQMMIPVAETRVTAASRVSENRRVGDRRKKRDRRANGKAAKRARNEAAQNRPAQNRAAQNPAQSQPRKSHVRRAQLEALARAVMTGGAR